MLSRKEFLKHLLLRGIRTASDLAGSLEKHSAECDEPITGFGLPETELSPALLAIEAERRGIDLPSGGTEDLRREIYQELARNRPGSNLGSKQP
jgi:hypothetical protein